MFSSIGDNLNNRIPRFLDGSFTSSKRKTKPKSKSGFKLPIINDIPMSRRSFLKVSAATAAVVGGAAMLANKPLLAPGSLQTASAQIATGKLITNTSVKLNVNGKDYIIPVTPRTTLNDAIRNTIGLTGTKRPCNRQECGGCTVVINGKNVYSCTVLAIRSGGGQKIVTVEGLANGTTPHPLQDAYVKYDAMQCSFCIPGQLMSAYAFLNSYNYSNGKQPSRDEIRQAMAGNICRCGTYAHQMLAIQEAAMVVSGAQPAVAKLPVA